MGKVVGLTYDLMTDYTFGEDAPKDANAEFDHPRTVERIEKALIRGGHDVIRIGRPIDLLENIRKVKKCDIVFNIAEGLSGRNRESQVPVILEMLGKPFVGADGLTLSLTLDKIMAKKILMSEGIPTPKFVEIKDTSDFNGLNGLRFPLIVKPRHEGSSKGIHDDSLVKTKKQLKDKASWLIETYKQPALAEEFITGSEFTVGIIGNDSPETLPVVQVQIEGKLNLGELFYTNSRIRGTRVLYVCPAPISKKLSKKITDMAIAAYKAVDCRDFGRVDFRVDERGRPYCLEINPLPALSKADVFGQVAKYHKIQYHKMINRIFDCALTRYGL